MTEPAVVFEGVSKRFRRGERYSSLRDLVPGMVRTAIGAVGRPVPGPDYFWALRDVSFSLTRGEALGIIGPNGAGKSTILKLLTRILRPTTGRCHVRGRVGALIEVAAGFHPDLTGRENIFLQGAIMGMSRAETARKFNEIVEFSGVSREFIETPVKRYSSGMNARLGFAIAAHLDPDVLIIDEVLSVGDATFQDRCVNRMKGLVARGVPIVFVSHNLPSVIGLCSRALLLNHGQVAFEGTPQAAVHEYLRSRWSREAARAHAPETSGTPLTIEEVQVLDGDGRATTALRTDEPARIRIRYHARQPIEDPCVMVDVDTSDLIACTEISSRADGATFGVVSGRGEMEMVVPRLPLLAGTYVLTVGIKNKAGSEFYDRRECVCPFSVVSARQEHGLVRLEHLWTHATTGGAQGSSMPAESSARRAGSVRTDGAQVGGREEEEDVAVLSR